VSSRKLASIEVVEDRTASSRCDEGFLRVARLRLRNTYSDGSRSQVYPCDIVSRPGSDAVVAVLYEVDDEQRIQVVLRDGSRPPIYLRKHKQFEQPDPREYTSLLEVVAGVIEAGDGPGPAGLAARAALEAREEAGCAVEPAEFRTLGGETFSSPGTGDEKVFYCAAPVRFEDRLAPTGDGSVMEESGDVVLRELADAIEACRDGSIPDMKTEVALLRLADQLGYIPQLGAFVDELPEPWRRRYRRLGIDGDDP
jgi:ADP-ribose pyrophosphatase